MAYVKEMFQTSVPKIDETPISDRLLNIEKKQTISTPNEFRAL